MAYDDQLNIRVPGDLKREFIDKAKEDGTTATELLVGFMKQYLGIEDTRLPTGIDATAIEGSVVNHIGNCLDTRLEELKNYLEQRIEETVKREMEIAVRSRYLQTRGSER